jgi:hypothetical protein
VSVFGSHPRSGRAYALLLCHRTPRLGRFCRGGSAQRVQARGVGSIVVVHSEHRVAIVLSDEFAPRVQDLSLTCHVWALHTPELEVVAHRVWDARSDGRENQLESGITLFRGDGDIERDLLGIVDEVELHHGAYSHDPPVSVIEVFGACATDAVRQLFSSLGFARFEDSRDGFAAYRQPS